MKRKNIFLAMILFTIALISMVLIRYKNDSQGEMAEKSYDEFYYVLTDDSDVIFEEKKLKSAAVYYNLITDSSITENDLKNSFKNKDELYEDYIEKYNEYAVEAVRDALDLIARREFDCFFYSALSEKQQTAIENILYANQDLVDSYYGDKKVNIYDLSYAQQLEFYNLYCNPDYVIDDAKMDVAEVNWMLMDYPEIQSEWADISDEIIVGQFSGREVDSSIKFDEEELEYKAFNYNLDSESDVTVKDLEDACISRNDLCDDFLCVNLKNTKKIESTFFNLVFWEDNNKIWRDLDEKEKRDIEKIYLRAQEIVADYYFDRRVDFCQLSGEKQHEVYKACLDSEYQIDESIMGPRNYYSEKPKFVRRGTITYINGNNIVVENQHNEGIKEYEGKYYDLSGLK
ncbi:hypothetical protein SAMN02910298_02970, partial [Pseudobutyrivibrio sp. YE44]|uniref:hypothetical protein n=1 Tax=Pseudobutyrivibrio sp. YE44 TaxID=1520802 RepID=UPI000880C608